MIAGKKSLITLDYMLYTSCDKLYLLVEIERAFPWVVRRYTERHH